MSAPDDPKSPTAVVAATAAATEAEPVAQIAAAEPPAAATLRNIRVAAPEWIGRQRKAVGKRLSDANCLVMNRVQHAVKRARSRVPADVANHTRRVAPLLLIAILLIYLLFGALAFYMLEFSAHEDVVRRFYLNFGVRRRQYSRQMTRSLFDDKTDNMLVIVDQANTQRIQDLIYKQLRDYENELPMRLPTKQEWTMANSLNYAWSQLLTIGYSERMPETAKGSIFAFFYSLLGVPFFFFTIAVCACSTLRIAKWALRRRHAPSRITETHLAIGASALYVWFVLAFAILLHSVSATESFSRALYTAVLSSFTIPTADYNGFTEPDKVIVLAGATFSLYLGALVLFALFGVYCREPRAADKADLSGNGESDREVHIVHAENLRQNAPLPAPRFQVIVDESGGSSLNPPGAKVSTSMHHY